MKTNLIIILIAAILTWLLTSCVSKEEQEYVKKSWEYKTKQLELDYIKQLDAIQQRQHTDSMFRQLQQDYQSFNDL
jgi:PBP1b-binding outer membrane lipoprotein LpoB